MGVVLHGQSRSQTRIIPPAKRAGHGDPPEAAHHREGVGARGLSRSGEAGSPPRADGRSCALKITPRAKTQYRTALALWETDVTYIGNQLAQIAGTLSQRGSPESQFAEYVYSTSVDSIDTVLTPNYISDGQRRGVTLGSIVWVQTSAGTFLCEVSAVQAAPNFGVTLIEFFEGGLPPGGSSGQLQYNNAGVFGGYGIGAGLAVVGGNLTATDSGDLLAANNLSDVASKPTSFNNLSPMTTAGDIIYGGAAGAATRLPAGTSAQVLFGGAAPFWASPASSGSLAEVATISALAATNPTTQVVYLSDPVRGGNVFVWFAGNFTTTVTFDPAKAITVAWTGDSSPGATGAWVRQYTGPASIAWFGAVGDAVITFPTFFSFPTIVSGTDNSQALANWGTWARYQSSLDIPVIMTVPPPSGNGYLFNAVTAFLFGVGIKKLIWYNNKALWQNTTATESNPWTNTALGLSEVASTPAVGLLIKQTQVGAYGFTMVNATDALIPAGSLTTGATNSQYCIYSGTNWTSAGAPNNNVGTIFTATNNGASATGFVTPAGLRVGGWNVLTSIDAQYFGFPPNPQQFEYVKVDGINTYPAATPTSVTYTSGTGLLALVFSAAPYASAPVLGGTSSLYFPGLTVTVSGLTGTGVSPLNADWPILSVSANGLTVTLQTTPGLGALTIGGGQLGPNTIIQTQQNLRFQHRTDYPDSEFTSGFLYKVGKGRVWILDTGPWTINGVTYPIITWDIDHEYYDLYTGFNQVYQYWSFSGRRIRTYNYVGAGFSESVVKDAFHKNPTLLMSGEPDKMVESFEYDGLDFFNPGQGGFGPNAGMGFQSPNGRLVVRNSKITGFNAGTTKSVYCENNDIGFLALYSTLGFSPSQIYVGGFIHNAALSLFNGAAYLTFDGTNAAFGSAIVTITIASPAVFTLSAGTGQPTAAPAAGTICILSTTGALPTGFTAGTQYFVVSPSGATFELAATSGGSAINSSGSQSGVQMAGFGAGSGPGVITLNKANFPFGGGVGIWSAVPGMTVNLTATNGLFTGSSLNTVQGNGVILSLTVGSPGTELEFAL